MLISIYIFYLKWAFALLIHSLISSRNTVLTYVNTSSPLKPKISLMWRLHKWLENSKRLSRILLDLSIRNSIANSKPLRAILIQLFHPSRNPINKPSKRPHKVKTKPKNNFLDMIASRSNSLTCGRRRTKNLRPNRTTSSTCFS